VAEDRDTILNYNLCIRVLLHARHEHAATPKEL
jgi:hypothetical protein